MLYWHGGTKTQSSFPQFHCHKTFSKEQKVVISQNSHLMGTSNVTYHNKLTSSCINTCFQSDLKICLGKITVSPCCKNKTKYIMTWNILFCKIEYHSLKTIEYDMSKEILKCYHFNRSSNLNYILAYEECSKINEDRNTKKTSLNVLATKYFFFSELLLWLQLLTSHPFWTAQQDFKIHSLQFI